MNFKEIIEKCLKPLEADSPVGEDVKYDDLFAEVSAEISKLTSGAGKPDWKKVADGSIKIISEKSKDLNTAGYLCLGLFIEYGYEGLAAGFEIYHGILTNFEPDYFPKRKKEPATEKVRRLAVEWLNLRIPPYIKDRKPKNEEFDYVLKASDELIKIQEISQNIAKPPPALGTLVSNIDVYKGEAESEKKEKEQKAKEKAEKENAEKDESKIKKFLKKKKPEKKAEEIEKKAFEAPSEETIRSNPLPAMISIATGLREEDPSNPIPYRLLRVAKWDSLKKAPDDKDGITKLPLPVIKDTMGAVRTKFMENKADPIETIQSCEKVFSNWGLWWLDLQRTIFNAAQKAGDNYKSVVDVIKTELIRLLKRFPELPNKKFADGTSFADDNTKSWLEDLKEGQTQNTSVSSVSDNLAKELENARNTASEQDINAALSILQQGVSKASNKENAFHLRLLAGQLCLKNNKIKEGRVILEDLFQQTKNIKLEDWNPALFSQLCIDLEKAYHRDKVPLDSPCIKIVQEALLRTDLRVSLESGK